MKTGTWKGGSSPHQPSARGSSSHAPAPPLNIRLPMTTAPVAASDSATIPSSVASLSPPGSPWLARQLASRRAHSCSRSPPSPSGCSSVGFGPATKPSSDVETSSINFGISLPLSRVGPAKEDRRARRNSSLHPRRAAPREISHLLEGRHRRVARERRQQRPVGPAELDRFLRLLAREQAVEEPGGKAVPAADPVEHVELGGRRRVRLAVDPGDGSPSVPVAREHLPQRRRHDLDPRVLG